MPYCFTLLPCHLVLCWSTFLAFVAPPCLFFYFVLSSYLLLCTLILMNWYFLSEFFCASLGVTNFKSMTYNLPFWMFRTQITIASSSYSINMLFRPTFLDLVLPFKWSKSEFNVMFQYFVTFLKDVCSLSITSMAFTSCWSIHLAHFEVSTCLLTLPSPCIVFVARWYCCYINGQYCLLSLLCCWGGMLEMLILFVFTIGT